MKKFNILLLIIVWLANPTFFVFADFNKTNQGNKENILFDDKEYIQINDPILKKGYLKIVKMLSQMVNSLLKNNEKPNI